MNKTCLIRQTCGIGDIFFCQKIGYHFQNLGYDVIWPVIKEYDYIKDYIINFKYPCVESEFIHKDIFIDLNNKEIIWNDDLIFLPLHGHNLRSSSVMKSKYKLVGEEYKDWKDYFNFKRNTDKENELFNLLNPNNEPYALVNLNYASPPGTLRMQEISFTSLKKIEIKYIDGYTLFDWCKLLENASDICMTDSAMMFLIEKLNMKTNNLICLLRHVSPYPVSFMFKKTWKYLIGKPQ